MGIFLSLNILIPKNVSLINLNLNKGLLLWALTLVVTIGRSNDFVKFNGNWCLGILIPIVFKFKDIKFDRLLSTLFNIIVNGPGSMFLVFLFDY